MFDEVPIRAFLVAFLFGLSIWPWRYSVRDVFFVFLSSVRRAERLWMNALMDTNCTFYQNSFSFCRLGLRVGNGYTPYSARERRIMMDEWGCTARRYDGRRGILFILEVAVSYLCTALADGLLA